MKYNESGAAEKITANHELHLDFSTWMFNSMTFDIIWVTFELVYKGGGPFL